MYMFKTKNLAYQKMKCFKQVKFEPCFEFFEYQLVDRNRKWKE